MSDCLFTNANYIVQQYCKFYSFFLTVCEEQRQLLGTEEESSDRHSSEAEEDGDSEVWVINDEQLEYYRTQFCNLQPDPNSLLPGSVARQFFEKSRLPVQELRKIW